VSRDPDALSLFIAHRGELVSYADKILGDRAHAEDVVQEAYLKFDAACGDRILGEPLAYLYRIVRNLALDVRRRLARDRNRLTSETETQVEDVRDEAPSPEAEAGGREQMRLLTGALAELPDRTRDALEMHRFDGLTIREIADRLGISVGLAHALVVQGIEHCRTRLFRKS